MNSTNDAKDLAFSLASYHSSFLCCCQHAGSTPDMLAHITPVGYFGPTRTGRYVVANITSTVLAEVPGVRLTMIWTGMLSRISSR